MGKKDNVAKLIKRSGGKISLSALEAAYKETHTLKDVPAKLTFEDWIKTFGGIEIIRVDSGEYDVSLTPPRLPPPLPPKSTALRSQDSISGAGRPRPPPKPPPLPQSTAARSFDFLTGGEQRRILALINGSDGDISISNLNFCYEEAYGTGIEYPKEKLLKWIEGLDSVGTRKLDGTNDVVVFAKIPKRASVGTTNNVTEVKNKEPTDFLMVEKETGKSRSDCEDVVQKLMSYAGGQFRLPVVHQDTCSLLDMLPMHWSQALSRIGMERVTDISLDLGRRPYCWHEDRRKYLCEASDPVRRGNLLDVFGGRKGDKAVEDRDIQGIVSNLEDFGGDNRAGIDGQLHRISCIRNNTERIIGLTIRVGRHVEGNADMIRDLLEEGNKSILLLGEPGSGKTTIVRDVTKILSQKSNVFVVDTSNEIAGDGNVPHPCVGDARRLMVKSLSSQADTMIECVQNHTPSVMVIDEIGRKREVEAAQTSKNRGVRMIASAHGDLRSLMKNKDIRGLIGGLETVTLGDGEAKDLQKKTGAKTLQKQLTTRAAVPIFDTIIELKRGRLNEWHVIPDAAKAVDDILLGEKYEIQKRLRCVNSGNIFVERIKN